MNKKTFDDQTLSNVWREHEERLEPPSADHAALCRRRDALRRENAVLLLGAGFLVAALALMPSETAASLGSAHATHIVDSILSMP